MSTALMRVDPSSMPRAVSPESSAARAASFLSASLASAISSLPLTGRGVRPRSARAADEDPLQHDEEQQQGADDDLRPPGGQGALEGDEGLDQAEDEPPEQGTDHQTDAPRQQRPADDGGGDRVELGADRGE